MRINSVTPYDYVKRPSMKGDYSTKKCLSAPLVTASFFKLSPLLSKILINIGAFFLGAVASKIFSFFAEKRHKKPVQLAPKIEYKEANTLKEACNFAKENFKIKKFKVKDLSVANWINEGLTILSNKFKGNVYMPRKIKYTRCGNNSLGGKYSLSSDCLKLNKIPNDVLDNSLDYRECIIRAFLADCYPITTQPEEFRENLKNMKNLSPVAKWTFSSDLLKISDIFLATKLRPQKLSKMIEECGKDLFGPIYIGTFGTLYHEMGHVFDLKSSNDTNKTYKEKEKFFQNNSRHLVLPNYAKSNHEEFVAETFAGIINGAKYRDELMELFNSMTNIKLPND